MQSGTRDSARTIAVLSGAYLESVYGGAEWQGAWASDPDGTRRKLLVVRVTQCERPGLLAGVVGVDLFGVTEVVARTRLRDMVTAAATGRAKPSVAPGFPGAGRAVPYEPQFPGPEAQMISPSPKDLADRGPEVGKLAGRSTIAHQSVSVIEVAISPGEEPDRFQVEVVSSPAGKASAVANLDAERLLARRDELETEVIMSAAPTRRPDSRAERRAREVGQELFSALLGTGEVAARYRATTAMAAARGQAVRVVLRIEDPSLAGLPWEAMFDGAAGGYVCLLGQLVRYVAVSSLPEPLPVDPPLKILGIVSTPRDLALLDADKEKEQLTQALARPISEGLTQVTWAPSAVWADLQDVLLSGEWHVVHYIGHGDFDPDRGEGVLVLTGEDDRADPVGASRLVDLLRQTRPVPRLVVLNSPYSARSGATDLFSGTAAALARGGVSAVAAMQYTITDRAAAAFVRGFYGAIARGREVADAVSSGRVAIMGVSGLEWMTPVLYLRGQDSRLFTMPA